MSRPDVHFTICARCRRPERIAAGAADIDALTDAATRALDGVARVRNSQCLNCCDAGHTVRVEHRGVEVALVGIRTVEELLRVVASIDRVATGDVPAALRRRVYQVWRDGQMLFHRGADIGDEGDAW